MATKNVSSTVVPPQVPATIRRKQKSHVCTACQGIGELSEKEFTHFGTMLDLATAMLALQKKIKAAQVDAEEDSLVHQAALAFETFFSAIGGIGESGKDSPLSKEDLAFLSELNISATA